MAAPGQADAFTICLGTDPKISDYVVSLRAHDSHDEIVALELRFNDWLQSKLEGVVQGVVPNPEEILQYYNEYRSSYMGIVGDDHGNCGNPLDENPCHVLTNFNVDAHRWPLEGQAVGDRMVMECETFRLLRNATVCNALLEGGTPEDKLTPAIAAEAFDLRVSYSDYYQVSCIATPECKRGNNFDKCFEPQLIKDAEERGLSGKSKAEKLRIHDVSARSGLGVRALYRYAKGNGKLTVLMASFRSNKKLFNNPDRDVIVAFLVRIFITSHPSTFTKKSLRNPDAHPPEELERMSEHLLEFLKVVFAKAVLSNGTPLSLPSSAEEFKLFHKVAGYGDLSPAQMEALLEAQREGRVLGGTNSFLQQKGVHDPEWIASEEGHAARSTGGTNCYLQQKGVHDPEWIGSEEAHAARALGGTNHALPLSELIHSSLLSLAKDHSWNMRLPSGALLSDLCDINNVELRHFYLANTLSPAELVRHEPALLDYRNLTADEEEAVRRDANGDVEEALKKAAAAKVKLFSQHFRAPRRRTESALKKSGQAVPSLAQERKPQVEFTVQQKLDILSELEAGAASGPALAEKHKTSSASIYRWKKDKDRLLKLRNEDGKGPSKRVSNEEHKTYNSKRKSNGPAPVRPPKKALLARAKEDKAAGRLPYAPKLEYAQRPWSGEETVTVEVEVGADDQTSTHSVETYRSSNAHSGEWATGREEGAPKTKSSAAIFDDRPTSPSSNGHSVTDDGYSADLSNYILEAHAIEECSTANSYHGLALGKALPTTDEDDDSRRQGVGYGHAYNNEPLPPTEFAKPVVPAAFPSLMDASVSSAWTASTAPSMTSHSVGMARNVEGEEREDSLRPTIAQDPPAGPPVGAAPGDPLAATEGEVAPFAIPAATAGGVLDPRMNVDYERRYIVDLERINEESSGGLEVGSYGRKASGGDGRASAASSLRETEPGPTAVPSGGAAECPPAHGPPPPPPPATANPPTEFYDYRHQYYTEQLHYFDGPIGFSKGAGGDDGDDETDSTCSSVTLSQAFHPDLDGAASIASSLTDDDHSASRGSTVSSVTLSRALSADRHDHADGGFYVATRLGDYVEVPKDAEGSPVSDDGGEDVSVLQDPFDGGSVAGTDVTDGDAPTADTATGVDVVSDAAAAESKGAGPMAPGRHAGDDLLAALVPECGVPVPSVMATVGATSSGRRSGKGGYLLPWHSARSIGNYQHGRRGKKKGAPSQSSRHASLLSTSSVHTFRG